MACFRKPSGRSFERRRMHLGGAPPCPKIVATCTGRFASTRSVPRGSSMPTATATTWSSTGRRRFWRCSRCVGTGSVAPRPPRSSARTFRTTRRSRTCGSSSSGPAARRGRSPSRRKAVACAGGSPTTSRRSGTPSRDGMMRPRSPPTRVPCSRAPISPRPSLCARGSRPSGLISRARGATRCDGTPPRARQRATWRRPSVRFSACAPPIRSTRRRRRRCCASSWLADEPTRRGGPSKGFAPRSTPNSGSRRSRPPWRSPRWCVRPRSRPAQRRPSERAAVASRRPSSAGACSATPRSTAPSSAVARNAHGSRVGGRAATPVG